MSLWWRYWWLTSALLVRQNMLQVGQIRPSVNACFASMCLKPSVHIRESAILSAKTSRKRPPMILSTARFKSFSPFVLLRVVFYNPYRYVLLFGVVGFYLFKTNIDGTGTQFLINYVTWKEMTVFFNSSRLD